MSFETHKVVNQFDELRGYNLLASDLVMQEALTRAGAEWAQPLLHSYGAQMGSHEAFQQAEEANRHEPELRSFDARGRRIDAVDFHPSWHATLARMRGAGFVSLPFRDARPGRWAVMNAGFYLHSQVESGSACPSIMTLACIPLLQREPWLWPLLEGKLFSDDYDPRDLPIAEKRSIYVGMGMTEKQGGSDVRANSTTATPAGAGGRGGEYLIRGHKWFFSAPMSDAHLVVAQLPDGEGQGGPGCFFVPRWRMDGGKNAIEIQRLKDKVGNRSNSSSEVEFKDAQGFLIGEEGRGIPTIIEMANYTRLACVTSSAAFIRQALVQAIAYTRQRQAFGRPLADQPLMRAVLADLALESEAATVLAMRLAQAFEHEANPAERLWKRLITPAAKFWVCKRAVELTGEAMEVFGGNGYVETGAVGRLFREAPVNSIWEGSGNVMCLDVMRAFAKEPQTVFALLDSFAGDARVDREIARLRNLLQQSDPKSLEGMGRLITQSLVLIVQAALLRQHSPAFVAEAFIATRFGESGWGRVAGAIDTRGIDVQALLDRALPHTS